MALINFFNYLCRKYKEMRKLTYDPKKLEELYNQGKNDAEIARELNCNNSVIYDYRKKHKLPSVFKYECKIENKLEEIKLLKEQGMGNRKISKLLNIPRTSLMYLFRKHKLDDIKYIPKDANLNYYQRSALIGSLLGDSSINKKGTLNIGHGLKQEEYYRHKIQLFSPNIHFLEYRRERLDKRTNNVYVSLQAYSNRYEDIVELREVLYVNGKKEIPDEILKKFNDISLAYLFMDDGSFNPSGGTIALCNFSKDSILRFQKFLLQTWDIETSIMKNKSLYIRANSRKLFRVLILPYIIPSMMYKIKMSSLNSVNLGKPLRGQPLSKLNRNIQKEQRLDEVILTGGAEDKTSTSAEQ